MRRLLLYLCIICALPAGLSAQTYTDYLGAGHDVGITVTTSQQGTAASSTIDGFPVSDSVQLKDASRFLAQATLGYDYDMIQMTAAMGYEAWIDEQFDVASNDIIEEMIQYMDSSGHFGQEDFSMYLFRTAWWDQVLSRPDLLRQRMNLAMSELFVISASGSDLFEDVGTLSGGYYKLLNDHAFGNYRELLRSVSLSPSMGLYLSHMNNPKSDTANNIHPDENYAREVMQLFSIGLYELNNNGSLKLDAGGRAIPTYSNDDIREFAKIFTGFGDGRPDGKWENFDNIKEFEDIIAASLVPMKMYEEWHEPGPKYLLNGLAIPAGQTGMQDFEMAIDNLYHHPNVGPFIGKALIQFLVSSNPSPGYIDRVASVFNDNGEGERGDMKAVIKAILLDDEARNCRPLDNPSGGKLREPLVRYTNFLQAFRYRPRHGYYLDMFDRWFGHTSQVPYYASSVFNFFQPDFQPNGPIAARELVAPVFQIHNSSTAIGYANEVFSWTFYDAPFENENILIPDFSEEQALLEDVTSLVSRLDILLAAGQLSAQSKEIILEAVEQAEAEDRLDLALFLIMVSPEYAVLK